MDATRLAKLTLVLGVVVTVLLFFGVLRLLSATGSSSGTQALATVAATLQPSTTAGPATPVATARASATAAAGGGVTAVANAYPNVHSSIGVTSPIVGTLTRGDSVQVVGRTADGVWLQIRYPRAANGLGWVSADLLTLSAPASAIPVATP